jgi:SanA protein
MMPDKRKLLYLMVAVLLCALISTGLINRWVETVTDALVYSDIEVVPHRDVALVLGTNPLIAGRYINPYFTSRIEAAASLYHSGVVKHLLVSGDNSQQAYDEPTEMKRALMTKGVPEEAISLDYAGFRTLDSVVRSKYIFQQQEVIIVSQAFHNKRALFIAHQKGINAIAYNAETPLIHHQSKVRYREYFARVKAVLDIFVLRKEPHFYGEKITLPIS